MQRERKGTVSLKGIVTYDCSADGKSILVPLDGQRLLRDACGRSRGDQEWQHGRGDELSHGGTLASAAVRAMQLAETRRAFAD